MTIPSITALPTAPQRTDAPATFVTRADAFVAALPTLRTQINAATTAIDAVSVTVGVNAATASADAATASAAASAADATANAELWVSAASYTAGQNRYSPINYLTYRAITTHSGVSTDPSLDATNWVSLIASGGATDAQAAQITLNAFNIAVNGGLTVGNMIDGVVDTFTDATGTDTEVLQPAKGTGKYFLNVSGFFGLGGPPTYSSESFSVASQESVPRALAFNADGTKFFALGTNNDTIYEYTCSVGFDLSSTVAYSGNSFSVASQENGPQALAFNTDGTKFFVVGETNDTVYEYTCSVGFDLSSTVAYSGNSFDVSGQDVFPTGLAFNADGTKMFMCGKTNDTVYEYTVSVGFDLSSTVAYSNNSFDASSESGDVTDIAFSTDGTKLLILDRIDDTIYEYILSVGFDLSSTVTYSSNSFDVGSQESGAFSLAFNADGTKMFVVGSDNDTVYEYAVNGDPGISALTTADFTALSAPSSALVVLHQNPATAITLNTNLQAWVSRTASKSFTTDGGTDNKITIASHGYSNGQNVLLSQSKAGLIPSQLNTHTPYFIINSATNDFELSLTSGGSAITTTAASNSGGINNADYSNESFSVASQETTPSDLAFNSDGTKFFVVGFANDTVYEYTCSVGFDLSSTVAYSGNSFSVASQETNLAALAFNSNGTKFFVVGSANDTVYEYTVSVGFDLSSTVAYSGNSFSVGSQETQPNALAFNSDGTKFFIVGPDNDTVYEYTCSVGFDLSSTVAYSSNSFSVGSQETDSRALAFNSDGTKFFVVGSANDTVYEYTCSVGFDLSSTVAYSGNSFSVASQETSPQALAFNSDGTKFFVVGSANDTIYEYTLSTKTTTSVYSQATLSLDAAQASGSIVSGSADLSGQASGTAIHTAIITPTETVIDLFALSTQWS